MARRPKYHRDQILDAALDLLVADGLRAVTVAAIARRLAAPSGSVYHRFASRDLLLASLWLRTVAGFQQGYLEAFRGCEAPREGLVRAVEFVVSWSRTHPEEGQLLLLHRREDLVAGAWPEEVAAEARALTADVDAAMAEAAGRLWPDGGADPAVLLLAAVSIPQGAVTPYLRTGRPVPEGLEAAVVRASLAALGG